MYSGPHILLALLISATASRASEQVVVSRTANDTNLLVQGYQQFASVPAGSWLSGSSTGEPHSRYHHSTVWTGQELIVWGGNLSPGVYSGSGARYHAGNDSWSPLSTLSTPVERGNHSAVWTGREMIVWGGFNTSGYLQSGGRYRADNQQWQATSTTGAPAARSDHAAVWTGNHLVVFGGRDSTGFLDDGGVYDPGTDTWSQFGVATPPPGRSGSTAIWTGSRLLIWGGHRTVGELNTGGQLRVDAQGVVQSWRGLPTFNAPAARRDHTAVWTGSSMIIWGGTQAGMPLGNGASYNPATDLWTALNSTNAPAPRSDHLAVWSGREMLVWGGQGSTGTLANGAAYDPVSDSWRTLSTVGGPLARTDTDAIWTGTELMIFGGRSDGAPLATLETLNPEPALYFYRPSYTLAPITLEIAKIGSAIELRWPLADSAGYVLEHSTNTSPSDVWFPVASPPRTLLDRKVVTLSPASSVHFFRLRR